jgi:hypothetical protein
LKENIIKTFYDGVKHGPETTCGTANVGVLADKDPDFQPGTSAV